MPSRTRADWHPNPERSAHNCAGADLPIRAAFVAGVGPAQYSAPAPQVVAPGTIPKHNLTAFDEILGSRGCAGGVHHTLSLDGIRWYFYNGNAWVPASGALSQSNVAGGLTSAVLGSFAADVGTGAVRFTAYLVSNGTTPCELAGVSLSGNQ